MRRLRQTDRLVTVSYSWRRPVLMQSPCCWLPAASAVQCLADAICLYIHYTWVARNSESLLVSGKVEQILENVDEFFAGHKQNESSREGSFRHRAHGV